MKTALLLSGTPRFCKTFDRQLENLQNSEIHWYVKLWSDVYDGKVETSPNWITDSVEKAKELIIKNLPINHSLMYIDLISKSKCPPPTHEINGFYYDSSSLWHQYTILRWCDQERQNYEKEHGKYDLVIRSRPDVGLTSPIDLMQVNDFLIKNPKIILLPNADRSGHKRFNDYFAIGLSDALTDYTAAMDHWYESFKNGVPWNPEYLMGDVMFRLGYSWPNTNFNCLLRKIDGHFSKEMKWYPEYGRWT